MALTVQAKLRSAFRPEATVLIEVRAEDPAGRLDGVLRRFGDSLDGRKFASDPIPVPGGRIMMIDLGTGPELLTIGLDWLRSDQPGPAVLNGVVSSAEVPLTWDTAEPVSSAVLSAGTGACLVATDFRTQVSAIAVEPGPQGWPADGSLTAYSADGRVAERMRAQRALVLAHADHLVWAGVTVEPDAAWLWLPQFQDRPADGEERAPYAGYTRFLTDRFAGDAMWFQALSAGHLQRLGGPPPGSAPLPGGRVAVTVGDPEQW
ncbi:hypothetical protein AB0C29_07615, partial [Actinoplanes sp. NPDC048791]|uniref:hypothetical protein n=1 Tax=Actinoplanes sp. NPDC048791 TaxID=3154623 RepID=UPI0034068F20